MKGAVGEDAPDTIIVCATESGHVFIGYGGPNNTLQPTEKVNGIVVQISVQPLRRDQPCLLMLATDT
jgi:hypothetical protein